MAWSWPNRERPPPPPPPTQHVRPQAADSMRSNQLLTAENRLLIHVATVELDRVVIKCIPSQGVGPWHETVTVSKSMAS